MHENKAHFPRSLSLMHSIMQDLNYRRKKSPSLLWASLKKIKLLLSRFTVNSTTTLPPSPFVYYETINDIFKKKQQTCLTYPHPCRGNSNWSPHICHLLTHASRQHHLTLTCLILYNVYISSVLWFYLGFCHNMSTCVDFFKHYW